MLSLIVKLEYLIGLIMVSRKLSWLMALGRIRETILRPLTYK